MGYGIRGDSGLARRVVLKGGAAVGGALLLPGWGRAGEARRGGTLRVSMPYNPGAIDPMTGRNLPDFNTLFLIYDALIDFDPDTLDLKPGLARSWRWVDNRTLALELAQGVTFHDGTRFDADAVKFNLDRYKTDRRSNVKPDLAALDAVEVNGPHAVTLHLNKPYAPMPVLLTDRVGLMVSPKSIREAPDGNADRIAVGTGPFRFVSWQDNERITTERNPGYWRTGLPYLDGVVLNIINELPTVLRSVTAGEADLGLNLTSDLVPIAERATNIKYELHASTTFYGCFVNYAKPPLDDLRVRQALNYAIDRDEMVNVLASGHGEAGCGVIPRENWGCDPATFRYYDHDPDKAKRLLAEAGHPDGIDLEAFGWPDQVSLRRSEMLTAQFAKSGIRLHTTPASPVDGLTFFSIQKKGNIAIGPVSGRPDPSQEYENLFTPTALYNASGMETPELRQLLDASVAVEDRAARKAALAKVQRYVIEQALNLTFYFSNAMLVRNPKVRDFRYGLMQRVKFTDVWMEA